MRRTLAINAAKWLSKRENRDKLKDKAREVRSHLEKQNAPKATSTDSTPEHKSDRDQPGHHDNHPQSGERK